MRADRLVSILLRLQSYGRMTASELAEQLEVSKRTIYRDMEALSGAGIPVVAERGVNGGWRLLDEYRTNLTGLKEAELKALFVSPSSQLLDDLGLSRTIENARNKLLASVPANYRDNVKDVQQRIHIDTRAWKQAKEQIASFETLQTAVWEDKKLDICYQRADGSTVERTVAPLGLVAKGNVWYLVALCEDDVRTYRASRIAKAALVEEQFARPPDFDLAHYWQRSTQAFVDNLPQFDVRVEVTTAVLARLKFSGRFVQLRDVGDADVAGWTPVTLRFDTEAEALATILGFADQMKIIEPYDLIHKVVAMAESVVTFYKNI